MKTQQILPPLALTLALLFPSGLPAIELGDPAPPLAVEKWVKGDPVDLQDGKGQTIYVVEFWATWCPPCRTSIPHLTEMQKEFRDKNVVVMGISDEKASTVEPFVKKMGDTMDYRVAVDDNRKTFKAYMNAFGVNGIPHAFVVDTAGKLVWHGHPMAGLDTVLKEILAGTFDMEAAKRNAQAQKLMPEYFSAASEAEAGSDLEKMGREILASAGSDPDMLNQFAWIILTHPRIKHRDMALALEAAKKAYDATEGNNAAIVDTYARALFDTGKTKEAIRMQQHAIKVCQDPDLRAGLEDTLDRYRLEAAK